MAGVGQWLPASWRSFWATVPVLMRSRKGVCFVVVPGHDHRAGALTAISIIAALVDTSLRAELELATRIGNTGKTDYTQSQTLSSQARTTIGI